MSHWWRAIIIPMLDYTCYQNDSRACKWYSLFFTIPMSVTILIIKLPSNERIHLSYQPAEKPISRITLSVTWNWRFKSIRKLSRNIQKSYISTCNRGHISESDHGGEDLLESVDKRRDRRVLIEQLYPMHMYPARHWEIYIRSLVMTHKYKERVVGNQI